MPESPEPQIEPQTPAERVAWLIPLLGEDNVRRLLAAPPDDAQRQRIRAIVANAPRRVI